MSEAPWWLMHSDAVATSECYRPLRYTPLVVDVETHDWQSYVVYPHPSGASLALAAVHVPLRMWRTELDDPTLRRNLLSTPPFQGER